MSQHRTVINGRTEFVFKCDKCGYTTDSIDNKEYQFKPVICPVCKEAISADRGVDLPDGSRGKGY
jgi:rubrerythrin